MGREARSTTRDEKGRKKRIPVGTRSLKLTTSVHIPMGKVGRWVADTPGRLQAFEEGGWTFVDDKDAVVGEEAENTREGTTTRVSKVIGTSRDGGGKRGYLMVIDKYLYDEDQAAKQKDIDQKEKSIKRGKVDTGNFGSDGMYNSGTKIEHN